MDYDILSKDEVERDVLICSVCRHAPLPASYISTVSSSDADASRVLLCGKATDVTSLSWPLSVARHVLLPESQILTGLSYDADASRAPSCEKTTDRT